MNCAALYLRPVVLATVIASTLILVQGCATLQVDVARRQPGAGEPAPTLPSLGEIASHDALASRGSKVEENWISLRSVKLNPDPQAMCLITSDTTGNWLIKPLPFAELNRFRVRNILTPEEAIPGRHRVAESRVNLALANAESTYESAAARELPLLEVRIATLGGRLRAGWASNPEISKDRDALERLGVAVVKAEQALAAGGETRPDIGRPVTDRAIDRLYALTRFKSDAAAGIRQASVSTVARDAAIGVLDTEVRAAGEPSLTEIAHVAAMYEGVLLLVDKIDAK